MVVYPVGTRVQADKNIAYGSQTGQRIIIMEGHKGRLASPASPFDGVFHLYWNGHRDQVFNTAADSVTLLAPVLVR